MSRTHWSGRFAANGIGQKASSYSAGSTALSEGIVFLCGFHRSFRRHHVTLRVPPLFQKALCYSAGSTTLSEGIVLLCGFHRSFRRHRVILRVPPLFQKASGYSTGSTMPRVLLYFALAWAGAGATVVEDFNHVERCKDALYMGTPPRGFPESRLRRICQRYEDRPRYVTLYDPAMRIPVYSAYTFKKTEGDRRVDFPWMYEPQLALENGNGNMLPFPQGYLHKRFEDSQAVLDDYANVVLYERGHLNPDQHQSDPLDRASTYTLTNVVPEIREFNVGPWQEHEERIRVRLNNYCRGTAYVVTGVTTAGHMIRRNNQDRVGVPEDVWSAYCCTDYDRNAPHEVRTLFPAHGAIAKNAKETTAVSEVALEELESLLRGKLDVDKTFQIFYDNCSPPSPLPHHLLHTA